MINLKKLKKSQAIHIVKLIEQIKRAEIMARLGRFDNLEYIEYATIKIDKENELSEYLFGTSNLVELGERLRLLKKHKSRRKRAKK